ncbi:MAG: hypothetical protein DRI40_08680 [Chloroflexi bacterium]|nr:MAG: hypothetical protein DRI40_08680 [Chloroflexota bacterium]
MPMLSSVSATQTSEAVDAIPKLLVRNCRRWGDRVLMRKKRLGIWWEYTWNDCYQKVKSLSLGLVSLGLEPGDKVAILGDSNPEWFWSQMAVQAARGTSVGLTASNSASEVKYIVEHSQSKFVIAQDQEQVDKLLQVKGDVPQVRKVIYWEEKGLRGYRDPILMSFAELIELGEAHGAAHPGLFEENVARGQPDDIYALQYTSGTTGLPKGAMISWKTLFLNWEQGRGANPVHEGDQWLSITLPAWGVEQTFGLFDSLAEGQTFNFAEKPETIPKDLREVAPHRILYPSRMWEQLASIIKTDMTESTWLKRAIFNLNLPIGDKVAELSLGGQKPSLVWSCLGRLSELVVFRALRDKHGLTRVRVPFTAGAVLAPDVIRFLRAIGLNLRQYYGSTEANALAVHTATNFKLESVGMVAPGRIIRISDEGEILADREGAFEGYFRDLEATERVFTGCWYHTGDAGYLDEDGHLIFMDRLQDMRQLADGTKFSPQYMESRLKFSPYIKDALTVGGPSREFIGAMINIDLGNVGYWAQRKRINYTTFADLSQKPEVLDLLRQEVDRINRSLPANSRIRRFISLPKEFDPDEAEMTRTGKLRRTFVEERYKELVEAMYGVQEEISLDTPVVYRDGRTAVVRTRVRVVRC